MKLKSEYSFVWSQEYQDFVDEIMKTLTVEYPLLIKKVEDNHMEFEIRALLIHSINYGRQWRNIK